MDEKIGISGEAEVEIEIRFPEEEVEVFGIWKDREDIKSSADWVRYLKEKEWRRW